MAQYDVEKADDPAEVYRWQATVTGELGVRNLVVDNMARIA